MITVIVPVCNVADYLKAALDSLLAQSVQNWNAICVDDGSTDGSGKILDDYAARDKRITVVHQANAGVSAARNAGLDRATGEIIAFLDADDIVAVDWLAKLQEGIRDVDFVWGGMTIEQDGKPVYDGPRDLGAVYTGDAVRQRVWKAVFGYRLRDLIGLALPGGMWRWCHRELAAVMTRAFRRSAIGDLRFDERVRLYEDALFLAAFATRARTMRVVGDTGYCYRLRPDGSMFTEGRERMVRHKFALRDARREIDPTMSHWRGSFLLSAVEVLQRAGFRMFIRYVVFKSFV